MLVLTAAARPSWHAQVFISYVTATAADVCKERKRATLGADDVLQALEDLEFAELLPQLREAYEGVARCIPTPPPTAGWAYGRLALDTTTKGWGSKGKLVARS